MRRMSCPNCDGRILKLDESIFECPLCSKKIIGCPNCKARNKEGGEFCSNCRTNLITGEKPPSLWDKLKQKKINYIQVMGTAFTLTFIIVGYLVGVGEFLGLPFAVVPITTITLFVGLYLIFGIFFMAKTSKNIAGLWGMGIGYFLCLFISYTVDQYGGFHERIHTQMRGPLRALVYPGTYIGGIIGIGCGWLVYKLVLNYLKKKGGEL